MFSYFRALRDSSSALGRSRRRDHLDPALILLRFRLSSPPSLPCVTFCSSIDAPFCCLLPTSLADIHGPALPPSLSSFRVDQCHPWLTLQPRISVSSPAASRRSTTNTRQLTKSESAPRSPAPFQAPYSSHQIAPNSSAIPSHRRLTRLNFALDRLQNRSLDRNRRRDRLNPALIPPINPRSHPGISQLKCFSGDQNPLIGFNFQRSPEPNWLRSSHFCFRCATCTQARARSSARTTSYSA